MTQQEKPQSLRGKEAFAALPRQPDGEAFYLHCTGGIRGALARENVWIVEPVSVGGKPCRVGYFSKAEFEEFTRKNNLLPFALQSSGWRGGRYYSQWAAIVPGRRSHSQGPSDLWSHVASNLARGRCNAKLRSMSSPTQEEIAALLDNRTNEERLAQSISLSLRSMDISIEQIAEFYHEQLVDLLASDRVDSRAFGSALDQTLFAHVHSFFMHFGAARDYLGDMIARRIGMTPKINSMSRLIEELRLTHFGKDALLNLLLAQNLIQSSAKNPKKWEWSGWLKEASDLRNEFLHRRPYGSRFVERFGSVKAIDSEMGLYRYVRPIGIDANAVKDVLDVITYHYRNSMKLFFDMAEASGRDTSMLTITDKDIVSVEGFGARKGF